MVIPLRIFLTAFVLFISLTLGCFAAGSGEYRGLAQEGTIAMQQGKLALAEQKLLKASKIARVAGPLYTFYAASLLDLGELYDRKKQVELSAKKYKEALEIYKKAYGASTIQAANCFHGLGELYRHNKKYLKSIPYYSKAIAIRRKAAPNHPTLAKSLYGQAKVFLILEQYSEAQPLLREVISIQEKVYGNNNKIMVKTLYELATAYEGAGKLKMAIPSYLRVVKILTSQYGENNQRIATTYERIGSAYKRLLNYKKAGLAYSKALAIREQWKDKNPKKLKKCINAYVVVLKKQGNVSKVKELEKRLVELK